MTQEELNIIIEKYLKGKASKTEIDTLLKFEEFSENNFHKDFFKNENEKTHLKKEIFSKIKKTSNKHIYFKYAASIALLISVTLFYFKNNTSSKLQKAIIPLEKITLKMDNGEVKIIEENKSINLKDKNGNIIGNQKGNELVYNNEKTTEKLIYNTLTVPYGKRFAVKLSDGTKVNLNAGTSFKYPIKFIEGKERLVYIENGEAFFDVKKDSKHPFIVNNNSVNVRVLGTKFNVSAYAEDAEITTVLIEGAVNLYDSELKYQEDKATPLSPGFKAEWNKNKKDISIEKANVESTISWIDGVILLKHMPFYKIRKKLERHYNVTIINNNKSFDSELITASFDIENIAEVFEVINELHPINYKIEKNKITIN